MSYLTKVVSVFRDHGMVAGVTAFFTVAVTAALAVARKAFTNDAVLSRLERELLREREKERERREQDKADMDARFERIEIQLRDLNKHMWRRGDARDQ